MVDKTKVKRQVERLNKLVFKCRYYANDSHNPYKSRSYKSLFWTIEKEWAEKLANSFTYRDKLINDAMGNSIMKNDSLASWKYISNQFNLSLSLLASLALAYSKTHTDAGTKLDDFKKWLNKYTKQPLNTFEDYKYFKGEICSPYQTALDENAIPYENFWHHEQLMFEHRRFNPETAKVFELDTLQRINQLEYDGIKDAFTDPSIKFEHKVNALFMEEMHWHWSCFHTEPLVSKYFYEDDWRQNYANKCLFYKHGEENPFEYGTIYYEYWECEQNFVNECPDEDWTYSDIGKRFPDSLINKYEFISWNLKLYLFEQYCDVEGHKIEEFVLWFQWYVKNWEQYKQGVTHIKLYKDYTFPFSCPRCGSSLNEIESKEEGYFEQCPICGQRVKILDYISNLDGGFMVRDFVNNTFNKNIVTGADYVGEWHGNKVYKYEKCTPIEELIDIPLLYIVDEDGHINYISNEKKRAVYDSAKKQQKRFAFRWLKRNLEKCRYYKGEKDNPFSSNSDNKRLYWDLECIWANGLAQDPCAFNQYEIELLFDFPTSKLDPLGTPMSLNALFYNRYCHWIGSRDGFLDFMDVYIKNSNK